MHKATLKVASEMSKISEKNLSNPFGVLSSWPLSISPEEAWHMSPTLISLQGTPELEKLSLNQQRTLSFYEAVNFYSLNIHGERSLIQGLAERLHRKWPETISRYLHHFLAEENNHMVLFSAFIEKYAVKIYADRHLELPREYAEGEYDFLFFTRVLIFEEIVDYYNFTNAKEESLHPVSREINRLHRLDESRHLSFGRAIVQELFEEYFPGWNKNVLTEIRNYLSNYAVATLKEYCNPDMYRDAGLQNPTQLARLAWDSESSRKRRRAVMQKVTHFLLTHQILLEEPAL